HTCDPGRETRREDRGIADRFSFPDRVIDGDFRGSPLLPLTLVRVDHLRPVPGVNLARQDILDEAELLLCEVSRRRDIEDADCWITRDLPFDSVGYQS